MRRAGATCTGGDWRPAYARATPYLTDASHDTAAQAPIPVRHGSFTATLPPRSLVTYVIPAGL